MVKKIVLIGLLLLGLTGCGQSGIVAQIGNTKITQNQVQSSIDEILLERSKVDTTGLNLLTGEELNRNVLRFNLVSEVFLQVGKEQGFKVNNGQIDEMKSNLISQIDGEQNLPNALINANLAPSDFEKYARTLVISDALTRAIAESQVGDPKEIVQQLIQDYITNAGIKINPRYGTWDYQSGDLKSFDPAGSALAK